MKQLIRINNDEINFRLKLNYNSVYSQLRMLLGHQATLFADIQTKSNVTSWYAVDDADYKSLADAPVQERNAILQSFNAAVFAVRAAIASSSELASCKDDILMVPEEKFIFYRPSDNGYKVVVAAWGCKYAHQGADPTGGVIKRMMRGYEAQRQKVKSASGGSEDSTAHSHPASGPVDVGPGQSHHATGDIPLAKENTTTSKDTTGKIPDAQPSKKDTTESGKIGLANPSSDKKPDDIGRVVTGDDVQHRLQRVVVRVLDQNSQPQKGEAFIVAHSGGEQTLYTKEDGTAEVGELTFGSTFSVTFPNNQDRQRVYEVEPNVEVYDAYMKKLVRYSPMIYVEDQHGNAIQDYNIKVIIGGQDNIYNTSYDGVVQLPLMQEGQKFIIVDTANYANSMEYDITPSKARTPYHFVIQRPEKKKIGITAMNAQGNPIPNVLISLKVGDTPCQQSTGEDGRAEFPQDLLVAGDIPVRMSGNGLGQVKTTLKYRPSVNEYTIRLKDGKTGWHPNWGLLALIPLLLLAGFGCYKYFSSKNGVPTWADLNKGVVLVKSEKAYYATTGLDKETGYSVLYFLYDENSNTISNATFDKDSAKSELSTGTGFFISSDGKIATNRHVADPIPPTKQIEAVLKKFFSDAQEFFEGKARQFQALHNKYSRMRDDPRFDELLSEYQDSLDFYKKGALFYDRILKLSAIDVKTVCECFVAFDNSMLNTWHDQAFHPCKLLISGTPGDVESNDLAIIQLNEKEKIMPKDAYIFKVPDTDPFVNDMEGNEDYEVWILGYNLGVNNSFTGHESGLHPQHGKGNVSSTNNKYQIEYNAGTVEGSSGAPVLNKQRQLVAINNSGINSTNIKHGVRTRYLKELMETVNSDRNVTNVKNKK